MALVSVTEICRVLAGENKPPLSTMRISQLVREGMPKADRGQYDPVRCMYWYIGKLRGHVERKEMETEHGVASVQTQRTRLLQTQAMREELELAKARGEIMAVADHHAFLAQLIIETKARIKAIAPRVAPEIVGETSRVMIQAKLNKMIDEALAQLSKLSTDLPIAAPATRPTKNTPKTET